MRMSPGQVVRAWSWPPRAPAFLEGAGLVSSACPVPSDPPVCTVLVFQLLPTGWMSPRTLSWLLARTGGWCVEPMGTPSPLSSGW